MTAKSINNYVAREGELDFYSDTTDFNSTHTFAVRKKGEQEKYCIRSSSIQTDSESCNQDTKHSIVKRLSKWTKRASKNQNINILEGGDPVHSTRIRCSCHRSRTVPRVLCRRSNSSVKKCTILKQKRSMNKAHEKYYITDDRNRIKLAKRYQIYKENHNNKLYGNKVKTASIYPSSSKQKYTDHSNDAFYAWVSYPKDESQNEKISTNEAEVPANPNGRGPIRNRYYEFEEQNMVNNRNVLPRNCLDFRSNDDCYDPKSSVYMLYDELLNDVYLNHQIPTVSRPGTHSIKGQQVSMMNIEENRISSKTVASSLSHTSISTKYKSTKHPFTIKKPDLIQHYPTLPQSPLSIQYGHENQDRQYSIHNIYPNQFPNKSAMKKHFSDQKSTLLGTSQRKATFMQFHKKNETLQAECNSARSVLSCNKDLKLPKSVQHSSNEMLKSAFSPKPQKRTIFPSNCQYLRVKQSDSSIKAQQCGQFNTEPTLNENQEVEAVDRPREIEAQSSITRVHSPTYLYNIENLEKCPLRYESRNVQSPNNNNQYVYNNNEALTLNLTKNHLASENACQVPHHDLVKITAQKHNAEILCVHDPSCVVIKGCLSLPVPDSDKDEKDGLAYGFNYRESTVAMLENNNSYLPSEVTRQKRRQHCTFAKTKGVNKGNKTANTKFIHFRNSTCSICTMQTSDVLSCKWHKQIFDHRPKFKPPCNDFNNNLFRQTCFHYPFCENVPACLLQLRKVPLQECQHKPRCATLPLCAKTYIEPIIKENAATQVRAVARVVCPHVPKCLLMPECLVGIYTDKDVPKDVMSLCVHQPPCPVTPLKPKRRHRSVRIVQE